MGELGGARPGAGRPRKRVQYAGQIAKAEKRIADHLPEVVDRMLELAAGVTVQDDDPDGGVTVYSKPPDREAAKYLLDRIMGKPTERKELSGPDGGPVRTSRGIDLSALNEEELDQYEQLTRKASGSEPE